MSRNNEPGRELGLGMDINRTILLLQELSERTDIPVHKFQKLKEVLESQFCQNVKDVYEQVYENVDIKEDSVKANVSAKATVAAFALSPSQSSASSGDLCVHDIAVYPCCGECAVIPVSDGACAQINPAYREYAELSTPQHMVECLEIAVYENTACTRSSSQNIDEDVATSSKLTPVHRTRVTRV